MEKTFYDYGKPEGKKGEDLLDLMDEGHTPLSLWALSNIDVKDDDVVLDIGCGSGLNIKRLHEKSFKTKTYGVDHSSTSVKKRLMKEMLLSKRQMYWTCPLKIKALI